MHNRIPGSGTGSSYPSPPSTEGGNPSSGSAPPPWLSASSSMPASRASSGAAAPRVPSQSGGSWFSALTPRSQASGQSAEQQPLLGAQGGSSSGGSWWQRSPPSQASPSSYQPPGSEASQLPRLAPPARGGLLFQAYADVSSATHIPSQDGSWVSGIQHDIEGAVRQSSRGIMPSQSRQETLAWLAEVQKDRRDGGSGAS